MSRNSTQYEHGKPAYLILEDGSVFSGWNLGAEGTAIGEVVFTTGMTGYQETLTDPSYYGQIVTQTFPLIGNYGVNEADRESAKVWLNGYIIREWCYEPSNFRSRSTLGEYLESHGIVGIYDIDTRALTRKLRSKGVMNGAITTDMPDDKPGFMREIKAYSIEEPLKAVSVKERVTYNCADPLCRIVMLDYGYKNNILRSLNARGCSVMIMPYDSSPQDIMAMKPDGIMLSNGPGDPSKETEVIRNLAELLKTDVPILGICLGHQLLAIAAGGRTEKLKYGHRGANQPVMDMEKDRIYVTSQNHGYAVVGDSITKDIGHVSHYNVNDGSCEGVGYNRPGTFTVQFHPEACAGPHDTQYLFDRFLENMLEYKKNKTIG